MRIPASNRHAVSRRYSYRQRSDEIFLPTGISSSGVLKEQGTIKSASYGDASDEVDDSHDTTPTIDTKYVPPSTEIGTNRSVGSVVVALNEPSWQEADTSVSTRSKHGAKHKAISPKGRDMNQIGNQENHFTGANLQEGNRAHPTISGSIPNKLGDTSSSSLQLKSGSLAERRLQQRSAIFKKGDLENQPSVVNSVLLKKRLVADSGGDAASVKILTQNHLARPDKPISLPEKQPWNAKRINDGVAEARHLANSKTNERIKVENSLNVSTEHKQDTAISRNDGAGGGRATDFATKLAWAAKLEKRRDAFAKKIPSPANRRQPTQKESDSNDFKPDNSEKRDTVTDNANGDKHDDRTEKKVVIGEEVAVVEEVYPSPSHLDFSNTKAWAAELAKQKVLSGKKMMPDKIDSNTSPCKSALDIKCSDSSTYTDEQDKELTTETITDKVANDEFSARLRAKRRQLSEKKRMTNDDVVTSSDKAEDSVWYEFDIPTSEKQQSLSLSYSETMDDQSVLHPVDAGEEKGADKKKLLTESNPLTPKLLLQEKQIFSLEKKRQSCNGIDCEEQENTSLKLVDLTMTMKQWMEELPTAVENQKPTTSNENEGDGHASSLFDTTPPLDILHQSCQDNQGDATSAPSDGNSESYAKNIELYTEPRKSDLHLSLTSEQQIVFTKIIAEYETKLVYKSSEIEYLKSEISNQHVQILELLGHVKSPRHAKSSLMEVRTESKEKKSKMVFSLKRLSRMKLTPFY